jgi:hypothetical protein
MCTSYFVYIMWEFSLATVSLGKDLLKLQIFQQSLSFSLVDTFIPILTATRKEELNDQAYSNMGSYFAI